MRLAFMALVAGFMFWGPFQRQVLGVQNPYLRHWVMFGSYGRDNCDLRFYRTADGSSFERLDRCEILGYDNCPEGLPKGAVG